MATIASTDSYSITLVNTSSSGVQGIGYNAFPHISSNGRYVVFWSFANNLVPNDTNGSDIFVKDLVTGVTTRATTNSSGVEHNGTTWNTWNTPISDDGRYVVFASDASNLAPSDTNGVMDIYLKDLVTGQTTRLSNGFDGSEANGQSAFPSITPDGRYVVFGSAASNLVPGDTNSANDVFVHDLVTGTVTRVTPQYGGGQSDITPDGRYVAFVSGSSANNWVSDVFVKDLFTGTTTRVSTSASGAAGNGDSTEPAISPDGRYVAFSSLADNLVPGDANGMHDIFVKDLKTGAISRVNTSATGAESQWGGGLYPDISYNGQYVVFESSAEDLVPGDTNFAIDIFVKDVFSGAIARVSVSSTGAETPGCTGTSSACGNNFPEITPDGRFIVFQSGANTLVPNDVNGNYDVFLVTNPLLAGGSNTIFSSGSYTLPADVENLVLTGTGAINGTGNALNNMLIGNSAANALHGDAGDDSVNGGGGNDFIDGGTGTDTAVFSAPLVGYIMTPNSDGSYRVSSSVDGLDTVSGVEQLQFSDQLVDLATFTGLNQGDSVFRFYNVATGTHFYTAATEEAEYVMATLPQYHFEGVAFARNTAGGSDTIDVYRFYNVVTNAHFYTASPDEAAQVRATLPEYLFEGVAYQAHSTESAGTTELYRFYNTATNTHFYTAAAAEAEYVKVELAGLYVYEGVAYYVDVA